MHHHNQRHLLLTFTLVSLLSLSVSLTLRFTSAFDFYHELGAYAMQFLFNTIPLNTKHLQILIQLLTDDRFDTQLYYNNGCASMNYDRAIALLSLIRDHKDLEMLLLGAACLSPSTITARNNFPNMWPPRGFPLLIKDFAPNNLTTGNVKDILNESLKHPESWQSASWVKDVNWGEMNDFNFWRMIPPGNSVPDTFPPYVMEKLYGTTNFTPHDLEELLMKLIHIRHFGDKWRKVLKRSRSLSPLLEKFSHLKDEWSINAYTLLKTIHSDGYGSQCFLEALFDSKLLQLASWKNHPIHIATNDIFELFIAACYIMPQYTQEALKEPFVLFLDAIQDWSIVRPSVLGIIVWCSDYYEILDYASLGKYLDRMLKNPNALDVLPSKLLDYSLNLTTYKRSMKNSIASLNDEFVFKASHSSYQLPPYIGKLYEEWARDRANWSGLMVALEQVNANVKSVFKEGTCDPKTDQDYTEINWKLAFDYIKFNLMYNIYITPAPSRCLLEPLLRYHKTGSINWAEFNEKRDKECIVPEGTEQEARYTFALSVANSVFFKSSPRLPTMNVELVYALFHGENSEGEGANELENRIIDMTL